MVQRSRRVAFTTQLEIAFPGARNRDATGLDLRAPFVEWIYTPGACKGYLWARLKQFDILKQCSDLEGDETREARREPCTEGHRATPATG